MDNQQLPHFPCRLCGTAAYVPPVVDGGDHEHHQVACNECGIEVCRMSAAEALEVWNRLMGPNDSMEPVIVMSRVVVGRHNAPRFDLGDDAPRVTRPRPATSAR